MDQGTGSVALEIGGSMHADNSRAEVLGIWALEELLLADAEVSR